VLQDPLEFEQPADRCETDICTTLVDLLDKAEQTIDFAIYGARNQTAILESVLRAKKRGVTVRGYVDRDGAGNNYYTSTDLWVQEIGDVWDDQDQEATCNQGSGTFRPQCPQPQGFEGPLQCSAYIVGDRVLVARHASRAPITSNQIMHNKFFVVDGQWVWTGSANISDSGTGGYNANAVLVMRSREIATTYTREFEQLRNRTKSRTCNKTSDGVEHFTLGDTEITTWFSPQDQTVEHGVSGLIARAEDQINVGIFFLTNKFVTASLIGAHRRGVQVRVITDATAAKNGYTKHELLRRAGIPVKVENWGGKMHAKAMSVDGDFLLAGSMNWTAAGDRTNDENSLLIRSTRLAQQFDHYYDEIWSSIPDQWARYDARPDPESLDSGNSCSDGVDNDFDDLVDAADPGCSADPPALPALPPHEWFSVSRMSEIRRQYRVIFPTKCDLEDPRWYYCKRGEE